MDKHSGKVPPNQGIRDSALHGLAVGSLFGLFTGLFVGLSGGGLFFGALTGLSIGLIAMLGFGLGAFSQHFILRFWLYLSGRLPWKLVPFLNEATERLLLSRIGGGYMFRHSLLMDYLASLENSVNSLGSLSSKPPTKHE